MTRSVWNMISAMGVVASLVGCSPSLDLPKEAMVSCATDHDCPPGWRCQTGAQRCLAVGDASLDQIPPVIQEVVFDKVPPVFRASETVGLRFTVNEPLAKLPSVTLDAEPPHTLACAETAELTFHCAGEAPLAAGSDAEGEHVVTITVSDRAANVGTAHAALVVDFTPPGITALGSTILSVSPGGLWSRLVPGAAPPPRDARHAHRSRAHLR